MQPASHVPIVRDAAFFVCADEERRSAMERAQRAATEEERLEATLIVTNLYQRQITDLSESVMPDLQARSPQDPDFHTAKQWTEAWIAEAEPSFVQWGEFQERLVTQVGRARAQEIANGAPKERIEAVLDQTKALLRERIRELGGDPDAVAESAERKTCPDCAEDIKAAARKCRYCGFRFEAASPG